MSKIVPLPQQEVNFYNLVKCDCDIIKDMYEASGCNFVAIRKELSQKYKNN